MTVVLPRSCIRCWGRRLALIDARISGDQDHLTFADRWPTCTSGRCGWTIDCGRTEAVEAEMARYSGSAAGTVRERRVHRLDLDQRRAPWRRQQEKAVDLARERYICARCEVCT